MSSGGETPPGEQSPAPAPSSPDRIETVYDALLSEPATDEIPGAVHLLARTAVAALDAYDREHPPAALRDALAEVERIATRNAEQSYYFRNLLARRDALAAENARLRAQVQAVEALCDDEWGHREHDDERCANCRRKWSKHGDAEWEVCANPERLAEFIGDLRTALATTEAGEES